MRARGACVVVAVLLAPAGTGAQTVVLTESEATTRVSENSARVQAARAGIDVARTAVLDATRWPNPRVGFSRESVAGVAEHIVTVSQLLPITGRRGLAADAASARVDAVSRRADERVRRLRADARLAFTSLWAGQARVRELAATAARLRELADVLGRRESEGEAAGFDALRAQRDAFDLEADRAVAVSDVARAQAVLASFFATPLESRSIEAARPDGAPRPLPPLDELVRHAETTRPELLALQRELDAVALDERAADRRSVPEPEVVAGTKSSNAAGGDTGSVVGVHFTLPLFDRARPERAAAQARAQQLRAEAAAFRQALRGQIDAWASAVAQRRAIASSYREAVTEEAAEIERIAQVSYDAGERGILELLEAYRTASAARLRQAALDAAVREAEIELEYVSGWEMP